MLSCRNKNFCRNRRLGFLDTQGCINKSSLSFATNFSTPRHPATNPHPDCFVFDAYDDRQESITLFSVTMACNRALRSCRSRFCYVVVPQTSYAIVDSVFLTHKDASTKARCRSRQNFSTSYTSLRWSTGIDHTLFWHCV